MKITQATLKKIIAEEVAKLAEEPSLEEVNDPNSSEQVRMQARAKLRKMASKLARMASGLNDLDIANELEAARQALLAAHQGLRGDDVDDVDDVDESAFAPNHYCVHHGGVQHEGKIRMAEAVSHNYNRRLGRVTHYNMKLNDGTILENVATEDIQVTNASLAKEHKHGMGARDDDTKPKD